MRSDIRVSIRFPAGRGRRREAVALLDGLALSQREKTSVHETDRLETSFQFARLGSLDRTEEMMSTKEPATENIKSDQHELDRMLVKDRTNMTPQGIRDLDDYIAFLRERIIKAETERREHVALQILSEGYSTEVTKQGGHYTLAGFIEYFIVKARQWLDSK